MNECPVDGCPKRIPRTMLMCKGHWFMVPADKRNTVWRTYRGGAGVLTAEYQKARDAAIDHVNSRLELADAKRRGPTRLPGMAGDDESDLLPPSPAA